MSLFCCQSIAEASEKWDKCESNLKLAMNWLDNATNYDNFEDFVQENTGNRFKLISPIQARILTNEHPCHMYGT